MKRLWSDEDLVAHFTLLPQDRELLQNKSRSDSTGVCGSAQVLPIRGTLPSQARNPLCCRSHICRTDRHWMPNCSCNTLPKGRTVDTASRADTRSARVPPITDPEIRSILAWMDQHILPQERDPEALTTLFYTRAAICIWNRLPQIAWRA